MTFDLPPIGQTLPFDDIIDVRSPAEFAEDHIPGAINLPALTDDERAEVGTVYVRKSRFEARRIGAAMVSRNVARHLDETLFDRHQSWRPLVYCWRGGQRSGSVAIILRQIGWKVETLEGGYRSYRRAVQEYLYETELPFRVILIDGNTGTAKTEILGRVKGYGAQVIDLEALASHRGSLFGAMAGGQPSQKWFETQLTRELSGLDPSRPVFLEAESNKIGDRIIPPALWSLMRQAETIRISAPLSTRAEYTLRTYGDIAADPKRLSEILLSLRPYHSADKISDWMQMANVGDHLRLIADLMRDHYDPRYQKSGSVQGRKVVGELCLHGSVQGDLDEAAREIIRMI